MASFGKTLVIDFETANPSSNSACAVGLVLLSEQKILKSQSFLIRPPKSWFVFTDIHGIAWNDVKDQPSFQELYEKELRSWFDEAELLVAHNWSFDRRVLLSTAEYYGIALAEKPWECTVRLSREELGIKPANLAFVCETLGIPLKHHDALSDALASAYIYLYAKTDQKIWSQLPQQ